MMVVEPFAETRKYFGYFPVGLPALLANPLVTSNRRWQQAPTYGSPLGLAAASGRYCEHIANVYRRRPESDGPEVF